MLKSSTFLFVTTLLYLSMCTVQAAMILKTPAAPAKRVRAPRAGYGASNIYVSEVSSPAVAKSATYEDGTMCMCTMSDTYGGEPTLEQFTITKTSTGEMKATQTTSWTVADRSYQCVNKDADGIELEDESGVVTMGDTGAHTFTMDLVQDPDGNWAVASTLPPTAPEPMMYPDAESTSDNTAVEKMVKMLASDGFNTMANEIYSSFDAEAWPGTVQPYTFGANCIDSV